MSSSDLIWRTIEVSVCDLKPFEGNPRKMNESQAKQLLKSIEKFNLVEIPAINLDNTILAGNMRVEALKTLGRGKEKIEVRSPNRLLNLDEAREYLLRSNKNTGEWDWAELANFEEELLKLVGFSDKEFIDYFDKEMVEDEIPAIRDTDIELGDLFQLGEHKLLCGDAIKKENVERLMNGKKADLFFADPPYGISYIAKNAAIHGGIVKNAIGKEIINDTLSIEDISNKVWLPSFINAYEATTNESSYLIFSCQGGDLMMMMMMMIHKAQWKVLHMLIWAKQNFVLGRSDYHYQHEPILYGWKQKERHHFYGGRKQGSILNFNRPNRSDLHPTTKPIELCGYLIKNHTKRDDIVLDLFGGSGSTLIACEQLNRKCFMMEINPLYVNTIIKRWETFTGQKAVKVI